MDKVVKDIESAAKECGIESKSELIAFSSGFAARDAQTKISELEKEIQRLKAQIGAGAGSSKSVVEKESSAREKSRATEGTKHTMSKGGKMKKTKYMSKGGMMKKTAARKKR